MKNILYSVISEIFGILFLFSENIYISVGIYIIFHSIAIFLLSSTLLFLIPKKYRNKKKESFTFLFFFGFFTFIAGFIFLFVLSLYLLRTQKNIEYKPVEAFSLDEIYNEDIDFYGRRFGEGGLVSLIKDKNVPKYLKEKAFLALADLKSPFVFNLIKENLSNPIDEIRLLAFSLISKMEKEMTEKVHDLENKLKKDDITDDEKAEIYKALAQLYWDFVLYNIVDEEFKSFMIEESKSYALKSLEIKKDPYVYFLLGRIYLKLKDVEKAIKFLEEAVKDKNIKSKVIPYLAECYFYMRDYKSVKSILKELDLILDVRVKFVKDFWVGDVGYN
ncbi:tetratricopeptide repeat protein [Sulfurihydrogenibium subterraneum]|uniref:tetratricopeptide repeat protein n=1 Tax=Sulfurihydrogenibium subterraneum TaxID=171121 RepID=UPI000490A334|nr:tetratricopeptide repeat protein [Sulfurihydrogenibium subterraneum]